MSAQIKFKFEGTPAQLVEVLSGLMRDFIYTPEANQGLHEDSRAPSALGPQPVSAQQPPPPAPLLNPDAPPQTYTRKAVPAPAPTLEPLASDPVYGGVPGPRGPHAGLGESVPAPPGADPNFIEAPPAQGMATSVPSAETAIPQSEVRGFDFGNLPLKEEAWVVWKSFVADWLVGFECEQDEDGNPIIEQPDRVELLRNLSRHPKTILVLRWLGHYGSLQGAVHAAMYGAEGSVDEAQIDHIDRLSAHITQVSHAAYPDIGDFHDYSTRWSRKLRGE